MNIELGHTYRDRITDFTGVATGKATYISGCSQVLISPKVSSDGAVRDSAWFDEQRLEKIAGSEVVKLDNRETPGCDRPAPIR